MNIDTLIILYLAIGMVTALVNGAVRKIEADALLGFVWILCWWMTPLAFIIRFINYVYEAVKAYQPCRRSRLYFLRKF